MIRVDGHGQAACDGIRRRELLRLGGLSLLGMTLPELLHAEATLPLRPGKGKAKSVILLYLFGGPAVQETFDPKSSAPREIRGAFGSIPTSVPGVHFCEYLPQMAKWMDRSTLIRSATHDQNDHSAGMLYTMTGAPADKLQSLVPVLNTQAPSMNAVVEYLARPHGSTAPSSVWMPCNPGWGQKITRPGPFAGWLGRKWDPLVTDVELRDAYEPKTFYDVQRQAAGNILVPGTKLPSSITLDRFNTRRSLAEQLQVQADRVGNSEAYERFDAYQKRALDILADNSSRESAWRAFDLESEKPALRDRYGRHLFGECALTARRLVERGSRFVTVYWESYDKTGGDPTAWDTHEDHFNICKNHRLPPLDQTYSALCEDLQARGLLDETLVIVMGEMGRSPKVNGRAGRDHWSYVHNILMTGAGVKRGYVHGASDKTGARVTDKPVGPADFIATVYAAMGIDPEAFIEDAGGRLRPITPGGSVVREVLA
ncbi:MAG: DUF1501 domain-containing protein [Proteobacteria bacterium]|nr:DUF1501 domain-containing protein [Pseudomonadota bacterium]